MGYYNEESGNIYRKKGNRNRKTPTWNEISRTMGNMIEDEKNTVAAENRRKERIARFGYDPKEFILAGANDRLSAIPYNEKRYSENIQNQNAYYEGFYERGSRMLSGNISNLTSEQLKKIGYNDYVSGIVMEALPKDVRNNEFYASGYMLAIIETEMPNKKHR